MSTSRIGISDPIVGQLDGVLKALVPDMLAPRTLNQDEIVAIFQACGAFWMHPGEENMEAPHAQLTSGKCSNGYINCSLVLSRANLCQIMAQQVVYRLSRVYT